jgi:hypothetical protein
MSRRRQIGGLALLLLLAGCGENPLLEMAASNYAPSSVGANWVFAGENGSSGFTTQVTGSVVVAGVNALSIANFYDPLIGAPSSEDLQETGSALLVYSPSLGWIVDRKLPYVVGNNWSMPSNSSSVTIQRFVDGVENVLTPAGKFYNCYRLRDQISTYTGVTVTTGDYIWTAPNVGDIQYASVDSSGNETINYELSSYSLGQ